jgi:hypothetical protein
MAAAIGKPFFSSHVTNSKNDSESVSDLNLTPSFSRRFLISCAFSIIPL